MSDQAILNALAKRAELEAKIAKADETIRRSRSQIIEINKFIKQWEKFSGRSTESVSSTNIPENKDDLETEDLSPKAEAQRQNPKKEAVAEAAVRILQQADKPVSRDDLFELLLQSGIRLHGAKPKMVLSTMLWRAGNAYDIVRLKSGGYTLRSMVAQGDEEDTSYIDEVGQ